MTSLDKRMKEYESIETSRRLMKLLPVVARIDGKSFSNVTRNLNRPYDERFLRIMDNITKDLVRESNANIGYTQSDEINLIWYTENFDSQIFFDGKVHKMNSVLAAMASTYFNYEVDFYLSEEIDSRPVFDCRVFNVPSLTESANLLVWRELDAVRNSISMAARHYYSHKQLLNKSDKQKQDMLWEIGVNWNNYPPRFKRGAYFNKQRVNKVLDTVTYDQLSDEIKEEVDKNPDLVYERKEVKEMDIPFIKSIENKVGVLFYGEQPVIKES